MHRLVVATLFPRFTGWRVPSLPQMQLLCFTGFPRTASPRQQISDSEVSQPLPITISFLGTSFKAKAPVDDTILSSSMVIPGRLFTSEPVAILIFFPFTVVLPPLEYRRKLKMERGAIILYFNTRVARVCRPYGYIEKDVRN